MPRRAKARPSVDLEQIRRLASLSKLSFSPQEEERLKRELSSVLDYFATIDKVDVTGIPAAYEGEGGPGELRPDVPQPSTPDEVLAGVPQRKGRYVRAPRVF